MKTLCKISILMLAALFFAAGCGKDKIEFPEELVPEEGIGYLQIAGMDLRVSTDVETLGIYNPSYTRITRGQEEAAPEYKLAIINSDQQTVWSGTYADIKAMTEPLALQPGFYTMTAHSSEAIESVAWERPEYAGNTEFAIVKKNTTEVKNMLCTLMNIKTTVELAADLKDLFKDDAQNPLTTTVTLEQAECAFARDETQAAFFKAVDMANTLTVTLSGMYNVKGEGETPEYQAVTMSQTIDNVKAGQWRKISIAVEHTEDGNAQFILTVETWVYDDQIDVDIMSPAYVFGEEVIPDGEEGKSDPDSPVVSYEGNHSIDKPFMISESIFDMDLHTCNNRISLVATPVGAATIADAYCTFDSDNADFLAALTAAGYADSKIDLFPTNNAQERIVIRTDNDGRLILKVNDAGMFGLYDYAGVHSATLVVTDSQNRRSFTTLSFTVTKGEEERGPKITGLNGFDLNKRHTLRAGQGMQVSIDVASETGITGFEIEIIGGNVLTDDDLLGLSLAPKMDLINPASPAMKAQLQMLGFLPSDGSSIAGKTSLLFDITQFMPAMSGLGRTGDCDFRLIVTDAAGTVSRTLKFTITK